LQDRRQVEGIEGKVTVFLDLYVNPWDLIEPSPPTTG
jgi:hypothetical protein